MTDLQYTYGQGSMTAATPGAGGGGGGMFDEYAKRIMDMRMRAMQQRMMPQAPGQFVNNNGSMDRVTQFRAPQTPVAQTHANLNVLGGGGIDIKREAQQLALRDAQADYDAHSNPAPTKMLFGAQVNQGRVLDPDAMSGRQRAIFLPNNSQTQETAADEVRARLNGARDAAFQSQFGQPQYWAG